MCVQTNDRNIIEFKNFAVQLVHFMSFVEFVLN